MMTRIFFDKPRDGLWVPLPPMIKKAFRGRLCPWDETLIYGGVPGLMCIVSDPKKMTTAKMWNAISCDGFTDEEVDQLREEIEQFCQPEEQKK